jgi:hypothetical protein
MRASLFTPPLVLAVLTLGACSPSEDRELRLHTYQMGERVSIGHLIYTVFDRQWLPQIGVGVAARVPQNRFFLIRMNAVNSGGAAVIMPPVSLISDTGETFAEVENGEGVTDFLGALRQINPAQSAQGNLLFDVPPKHYKLKLSDEEGKIFALVEIPLSFDPDAPDIATPLDPTRSDDLTSGVDPTRKKK